MPFGLKIIKIQVRMKEMNCKNCNATMRIDTEKKIFFCPYCNSVEPFDSTSKEEIQELLTGAMHDARKDMQKMLDSQRKELEYARDERQSKNVAFYVVTTIGAIFTLIMMMFGFSTEYKAVGVVSLIQLALLIGAIILKSLSRESKSRQMSHAANVCLIVAALLVIVFFAAITMPSSSGKDPMDDIYARDYDWPTEGYAAAVPKWGENPDYSYVGDREFSATIKNATKETFAAYVEQCKKDGFTIDVTETDSTFNGYNDEDIELDLEFLNSYQVIYVKLYAAIEWASPLTWPSQGSMKDVPRPDSDEGFVERMSGDFYKGFVNNIDSDKFVKYIEECMAAGFEGRYEGGETFYGTKDDVRISLELKRGSLMAVQIYK